MGEQHERELPAEAAQGEAGAAAVEREVEGVQRRVQARHQDLQALQQQTDDYSAAQCTKQRDTPCGARGMRGRGRRGAGSGSIGRGCGTACVPALSSPGGTASIKETNQNTKRSQTRA